jgi:predicted Zn-dependent protease with MMP-like domain
VRDTFRAPLRAAAVAFLVVGTLLFFINPPSLSGAEDLITLLMGAAALVLVTSWATIALMGDDGPSELEFDRIVERSERLAKEPPPAAPPDYFDEIVTEAIDALPAEFRDMLEDAPVVVSHRGHEHRAYGHYFGDTVARDNYPDRIVIYRDTLERDFGHDPELLRAQVERTLRHEVGHHLGWGERGVRELGL